MCASFEISPPVDVDELQILYRVAGGTYFIVFEIRTVQLITSKKKSLCNETYSVVYTTLIYMMQR